jgi:hypothetical protein
VLHGDLVNEGDQMPYSDVNGFKSMNYGCDLRARLGVWVRLQSLSPGCDSKSALRVHKERYPLSGSKMHTMHRSLWSYYIIKYDLSSFQ